MGLITFVVPDDELESFTEAYLQKLASGPQEVIRFIKRAVYQGLDMNLRASLDMISSAMAIVTELEDYHEGSPGIDGKTARSLNRLSDSEVQSLKNEI